MFWDFLTDIGTTVVEGATAVAGAIETGVEAVFGITDSDWLTGIWGAGDGNSVVMDAYNEYNDSVGNVVGDAIGPAFMQNVSEGSSLAQKATGLLGADAGNYGKLLIGGVGKAYLEDKAMDKQLEAQEKLIEKKKKHEGAYYV